MKILLTIMLMISFCIQAGDIEVKFNHKTTYPAQQGDLERMVIGAIESSKSSIDVAVYDLDLPNIATALAKAHKSGKTVRLITDHENTYGENEEAFAILNKAKVAWIDDTEDGTSGTGIMHHKYIIVDKKFIVFGSANFTQSCMHGDIKDGILMSEGNVNHLVSLKSKQAAAVFQTDFDQMWGDGPGKKKDSKFGTGKTPHEIVEVVTDNDRIDLSIQFSPWPSSAFGKKVTTLENMADFVSTGEKRILFAQFAYSAQNVGDAAYARFKKGVDVRGVGDSNFFNQYWSEFLDMTGRSVKSPYQGKDNGLQGQEIDGKTKIPNRVWSPSAEAYVDNLVYDPENDIEDKFHHKFVVVDDNVLTGSHNISSAGAFTNDEVMVIIYNDKIADQFAAEFEGWFCAFKYKKDCIKNRTVGSWEGVEFDDESAEIALDIANNYSFDQLDEFLDSRAAKNIVDARPVLSLESLAQIPFVGPKALDKFKELATAE